jgi:Pyruvate/2-oxoacid:ferredoxin oxidoreductase delta subunit
MALFKAVKKPVIRQSAPEGPAGSALRPRYAPMAPPCSAACPLGCDVRGWASGVGEGEPLELAWRKITARNPFPAVTGRICGASCETQCHRGGREGAVAVREIERFVGDYGIAQGLKFTRPKDLPTRARVIGGGPAGLTAAYHLARRGYRVAIATDEPLGGALREAAPVAVVDAEIGRIVEMVEVTASLEPSPSGTGEIIVDARCDLGVVEAMAWGIAEVERVLGAPKPAARAVVPRERVKLEWYPAAERLAADDMQAEAKRCMSCGMCMACGNCWMYCSHGGFEKLPGGKRYKLKLDACNGCKKCADECPPGYIEMV